VQAGHTVAQFMIDHPTCEWQNSYLIYLKVRSLEELTLWKSKIQSAAPERLAMSNFSEPDIDNELTAIAVYGCDASMFKELRLL